MRLDQADRSNVLLVIKEAVHSSVFDLLVMLDGAAGTLTVDGRPADFAVYLQVYRDRDAMWAGEPQDAVRINPLLKDGDELHDLFLAATEPRAPPE
jgi:hypothetical protein